MSLAALDVLVVDDHEAMRELLTRALTRAGVAQVRAAADGAAALALLRERPAQVILADRRMPGMDGLELIAAVRADAALAGARIILLTGAAGTEDAARAAGADAVLVKPAPPSAVLQTIEAVLRG